MAGETSGSASVNPYAAPRSRVADLAAATPGQPAFFPVGLVKLSLMSMATLGLYELYWFYKNWKCVQARGESLNAPLRAFFYAFTSYGVFRRVREQAQAAGMPVSLPAGMLAVVIFVFAATWRLPEPYWLVSLLTFVPLLPVQAAVNRINDKVAPGVDPNRRFGGWNIAALVIGALLFVLMLIGLSVEPQ